MPRSARGNVQRGSVKERIWRRRSVPCQGSRARITPLADGQQPAWQPAYPCPCSPGESTCCRESAARPLRAPRTPRAPWAPFGLLAPLALVASAVLSPSSLCSPPFLSGPSFALFAPSPPLAAPPAGALSRCANREPESARTPEEGLRTEPFANESSRCKLSTSIAEKRRSGSDSS